MVRVEPRSARRRGAMWVEEFIDGGSPSIDDDGGKLDDGNLDDGRFDLFLFGYLPAPDL